VIAAYASADPEPRVPFWPLLFQNVTIRLLGSDDFPGWAKRQAATDMVSALRAGRLRPDIAARFAIDEIAAAHEAGREPRGARARARHARRVKRPQPGSPTSSPSRTTSWPRSSTALGAPRTVIPS